MWSDDFHEPETRYRATVENADAEAPLDGEEISDGHDADDSVQDFTQRYFEDISRLRILSADEEKDYARRMHRGDHKAREVLITHNLRLVVYVAKRYLGRGLPLLDLVEEGNLGLMHALGKFDPDRGFRLSTYATWWIRQFIERALMNQSRTIRLPVHVAKELNRCLRARNRLETQGVPDPGPASIAHLRFGLNDQEMATLDDLARDLQVSRERIRQMQREAQEELAIRLGNKGVNKEKWLP